MKIYSINVHRHNYQEKLIHSYIINSSINIPCQNQTEYDFERWLCFLGEYDFEIKHIKGKEKKVPDPLSRHNFFLFVSSSYESDMENQILSASKCDTEIPNSKRKYC